MDLLSLLDLPTPLLGIAITTALSIIAILSSVAMAVYAYQNRPEEFKQRDGSRFGLAQNRMEPGAPCPWGGGAPRWRPPLLSRTLTQPNLNDLGSYEAFPKLRLLFDTGTGSMDGGDLSVWLDKTPIFETVSLDSPLDERRLTDVSVPAQRKEWFFPKSNVQPRDVRVYLDDDLYGVLEGDSLEGIETATARQVTNNPEQVKTGSVVGFGGVDVFKYSSAITLTSLAWHYRDSFKVWADMTVQNDLYKAVAGDYSGPTTGYILLTKDMYDIVRLPDGSAQIVLTDVIEKRFTDQQWMGSETLRLLRRQKAVSIKVEYDYAIRDSSSFEAFGKTFTIYTPAEIFTIETNKSFRSKAVFETAIPAGTVTATYRTLPFGVEVKTFFQPGDIDQPVVPLDFLGQSRAVGLQLAQAIRRTYTTTVEVDDAVLGLSSGAGGFFRQTSKGPRRLDVDVRIRFKLTSAPDKDASTFAENRGGADQPSGIVDTVPNALDPSTGWVPARFKANQSSSFLRIHSDTTGGTARWAFRLSDAWRLALKDGGAADSFLETVTKLPREKYDIEVLRLSTDDIDGQTDLFLESVTETVFDPFNFPRRSFLLVEYDEQEGLDATPEAEVQFKMIKCRRYLGTFHVSREEQLGRWIAENSKPTQITLADGTVLTTGGALLDQTQFVYDPNLMEPRFRREWTRNPVWIACELILDELNGGGVGGYDPRRSIDWESAKRAADYCDELVTFDERTLVRSQADIVFTRRLPLFDAVSQILAGSGVAPAFSRGKWFFPVDDDSIDPDPVIDKLTGEGFTLADSDILDAEIDGDSTNIVSGLIFDTKQREGTATDLEITFPDEEAGYDQEADPVFVPANSVTPIRNVRRASFPAVRRRWQAERAGNAMMVAEETNVRVVTMKPANFRTLVLDPGDVVWFGSETAKLTTRKAQVLERVPGGSNLQQELKLLLLDGSQRLSGPRFAGPSGGVVPGLRQPTANQTGNPSPNESDVNAQASAGDVKSYITKAEEL